jgi:hypothetical protein
MLKKLKIFGTDINCVHYSIAVLNDYFATATVIIL